MILHSHPKHSSGGWTIFEMFFVGLLAGLGAFVVSSFFDSHWRGVVFSICFFAFSFGLWLFIFLVLLPIIVRRQQRKRDKLK
jgi:hypothetical protein